MFFKTRHDSEERIKELAIPIVDSQRDPPWQGKSPAVRINLEKSEIAPIAMAHRAISWMGDFSDCLLWIHEYGIWPSREDLNLYYRLRRSFGNFSHLRNEPGHLFLGHEKSDLATYLSLVIQYGWGAHVVPAPCCGYFYVSHDGWALMHSGQQQQRIISELNELSLSYDVVMHA